MNKNWYVSIHSKVFLDKELNSNEKLLIGLIHNLSNSNGYCYANNNYFSDILNVSKVRVSGIISGLIKKGYLQRQIIRKANNEIEKRLLRINIDLPINKKLNTPIYKNMSSPIIKNDKDNIQLINKIKL